MRRERVVLIKGNESNWYEQAIFILKPNALAKNMPVDLVSEAEKIVGQYYCGINGALAPMATSKQITGIPHAGPKKLKKSWFDVMLNGLMLISCIVLVVLMLHTFS